MDDKPVIKVKKLHSQARIPRYESEDAACFDLSTVESYMLMPGETAILRTGLAFEIPPGWEMTVRPRSGTSAKTPIRLSNSPGTIDADYRGEVKIIVDNISASEMVRIEEGQRLAQAKLERINKAEFEEVEELSETKRGDKGLGSTGK